jgi:DNA-binding NarL/FixJ family response regulator
MAVEHAAPEMAVVGEAGDGQGVLACVSQQHQGAAVMLLDMVFPDMSGLEVARRVLEKNPVTPIIFLNLHGDKDCAEKAFGLGVRGYLEREHSNDQVRAAIREVSAGGRYVSPIMRANAVVGSTVSVAGKNLRLALLTQRERQVMQLVVKGLTCKDIAFRLNLSRFTVQTHRTRLMTKLGLHSKAELVAYVLNRRARKR